MPRRPLGARADKDPGISRKIRPRTREFTPKYAEWLSASHAENAGSIPAARSLVARSKGFWGCPSRVNRYRDKPFGQI